MAAHRQAVDHKLLLVHDYYRVALNGPPREEGSLFSAHREPQPDSGWLD